ncbi:unnamed protein product [Commensalibacter communis]|uniref:hypothetical protein n=1 Tax=Commensalibacter communis TaxID=2972786 RepID=UPI0022FF6390|nr:hypothetical protein [Commensalibacter communis]CAI3952624.1 unnamed protein product [Commensalibacter communis]CAI3960984.1 unnamed protein product [Commensalibacter communis]
MHIDFSEPLGTYQSENGIISNEYQFRDILIYVEFYQDDALLEFHNKIKENYQNDYRNIPIIDNFAHQLFYKKNQKFKHVIEDTKTDITCLKVYSFRYYINQEYASYDCFINYDFLELIKD